MSTRIHRSIRRLFRSPTFATASIVTLALGLGANIAIFSVTYNVLFKPLPYQDPARLVSLWNAAPGLGFDRVTQSAAQYFTFKDNAKTLEAVALYNPGTRSVAGIGRPREMQVIYTTYELLPLLGARTERGRWLSAEDDRPNAARVVVLSHGTAESMFGAPEAALGKTLQVAGNPTEVIGVLPAGFRVLDHDAELYLPLQFDRADLILGRFNYQALARLADGATAESASAELAPLIETAAAEFSRGLSLSMLREAQFTTFAQPLIEDAVGNVGSVLWALVGTVGLLLLIAFANVANLFLVRAEGRGREVALRTAVGASRGDLVRHFLAESLTLCLASGALGFAFAWAALAALARLAPESLPRVQEIGLNAPVVFFGVGLSLLASLFFGFLPALRIRASRQFDALKEGGRSFTAGRRAHLMRHSLVVVQMGLALVLLIGSALLVRTFERYASAEPGYDTSIEALTFQVGIPRATYADGEDAALFLDRLSKSFSAVPGVTVAAGVSNVPLSGFGSSDGLWVEGFFPPEGQLPPIRRWKQVTGDYFSALGRPLIAGRPIEHTDLSERRRVTVVSENLALEHWSSAEEALGKRVTSEPSNPHWWEIVGVVSNVYDDGIDQDLASVVYFPAVSPGMWGEELFVHRALTWVLRAEAGLDPATLRRAAEQAVWALDPDLPIARVQTMATIHRRSFARTAFAMTMLAIAAGVALLLGVIGVYSTLSYIISQRTQEFGVRIALGAQLSTVRGMVLRQGLVLGSIGVLIGCGVAAASARVMDRLVYGVSSTDLATFALVSAGLLGTVVMASLFAARRATRVSPLEALRAD